MQVAQLKKEVWKMSKKTQQKIAPKCVPRFLNATPSPLTHLRVKGPSVSPTLREFWNQSPLKKFRQKVKYRLGVQKVSFHKSFFSCSISRACFQMSFPFSGDSSITYPADTYLRCAMEESSIPTNTPTENTPTTKTPVANTSMANEVNTSEPVTDTTNATDIDPIDGTAPTENSMPSETNEERSATSQVATNNFCKFPFKLRNKMHWDCVQDDERRGIKVCNVEQEGSEIPQFNDTSTFHPCGKCANPCGSKSNISYAGFPLNNSETGLEKYTKVGSWEDCQKLCQQVEACKFFNYHIFGEECELMYGVGGKKNEVTGEVFFGPKFCPSKQLIYLCLFICNLYSSIHS